MAYNRTDQEKGKSTVLLPENQWIIAIGKHPGLVPSKQWIAVQESLERNKLKGYRKARSNEALLTGLIYCSCGERMYPKLSQRKTADGQIIYSYVCKMKERSKRERCNRRNANGNILDAAIIEQLKAMTEDDSSFVQQLEKGRRRFVESGEQHEVQLNDLRHELSENEKTINGLIDALGMATDSVAKPRLLSRIEQLSDVNAEIKTRISELEQVGNANSLSAVEFDALLRMLTVFRSCVDGMSLEEKRAAVRTVVRKVIWDGVNAHVVLFGADEGEIEFPDLRDRMNNTDEANPREGTDAVSKSPWGEGSKSYIHKNTKGASNFWIYTQLHKQNNLGVLYYLNLIYLVCLIAFLIAFALSWISFLRIPVMIIGILLGVATIPVFFASLIYTNIEDVGQPFVFFKVFKEYNGKSRRFATVFDWLFCILPLALYVFFLTR